LDSLSVDLNRDFLVDTVIILSPIPLEPIAENYNCELEKDPKRMLVEIIYNEGKSKIRNVYPNLISNVGGVLSKYNGIFKTKDGFKIVHQAGAKYSWQYTIEFSTANKDKITLSRIIKRCSYEGETRNLNYYFKNQSIEKINIPDTLRSNCDCDKYWTDLEKNITQKISSKSKVILSSDSTNVHVSDKDLFVIDDRELFVKFPGGEQGLKKFIIKNLKYPESAIRDSIEGIVHVKFLIDENGKVFNITIENGLSEDIDKESIRLVSIMPNWIWDKKLKRTERKVTQRILPLNFKLH
jgi:TonB family protein